MQECGSHGNSRRGATLGPPSTLRKNCAGACTHLMKATSTSATAPEPESLRCASQRALVRRVRGSSCYTGDGRTLPETKPELPSGTHHRGLPSPCISSRFRTSPAAPGCVKWRLAAAGSQLRCPAAPRPCSRSVLARLAGLGAAGRRLRFPLPSVPSRGARCPGAEGSASQALGERTGPGTEPSGGRRSAHSPSARGR